jgi:hypothetical protein
MGRDNSREWLNAAGTNSRAAAARERLNDAVTELRRLADGELFQSVEKPAGGEAGRGKPAGETGCQPSRRAVAVPPKR